jgi:16S rRNA (cytidine1402-2'-O)-methyltransferase
MLSFIPTPIGNREDITLRALRLLREIDIFFCEDTSTAKKLCNMYEISLTGKQFYALTSFTDPARMAQYIEMIRSQNIGVMSEAGTP